MEEAAPAEWWTTRRLRITIIDQGNRIVDRSWIPLPRPVPRVDPLTTRRHHRPDPIVTPITTLSSIPAMAAAVLESSAPRTRASIQLIRMALDRSVELRIFPVTRRPWVVARGTKVSRRRPARTGQRGRRNLTTAWSKCARHQSAWAANNNWTNPHGIPRDLLRRLCHPKATRFRRFRPSRRFICVRTQCGCESATRRNRLRRTGLGPWRSTWMLPFYPVWTEAELPAQLSLRLFRARSDAAIMSA